eukprot:15440838-Alexandrium_andersonii.AAC.1
MHKRMGAYGHGCKAFAHKRMGAYRAYFRTHQSSARVRAHVCSRACACARALTHTRTRPPDRNERMGIRARPRA